MSRRPGATWPILDESHLADEFAWSQAIDFGAMQGNQKLPFEYKERLAALLTGVKDQLSRSKRPYVVRLLREVKVGKG